MLTGLRRHIYRIRCEILGDPVNRGRKLHYLVRYFRWHFWSKYRKTRWLVAFDNGLRSFVYPFPDHDSGELNIWTRNVDWYDTELVRSLIAPGDTIVDAGCNVGNRTWALADRIGQALMIDAGSSAIARTRENLALNSLSEDRFFIVHKALSDRPGKAIFTDLGGADTGNRILEGANLETTRCKTVELECTTIDAEVERWNLRPSYLKIDVEGQDLKVLAGARQTLAGGEVLLVKFERLEDERLDPFLDFFSGLNWFVFALKAGVPSEISADLECSLNLFAAPRSLQPKIHSIRINPPLA